MHTVEDRTRVQFTNLYPLLELVGSRGIVMETKDNGAYAHVLLDPPLVTSDGVPIDAMWVLTQYIELEGETERASIEEHGLFVADK